MKARPLLLALLGFVAALLLGQALRRGLSGAANPPAAPAIETVVAASPGRLVPGPAPIVIAPAAAPQAGRAPGEWQGMLVDESVRPPCAASARCGLARACVDGACVACTGDPQCGAGEVCVLDHCLRRELATCRSRSDCGGEALCVLSGYSSGPRGNEELAARCLLPRGGRPEGPTVRRRTEAAPPIPVRPDELLRSLDAPG